VHHLDSTAGETCGRGTVRKRKPKKKNGVPKVMGHIEPWRAQLVILSSVDKTYSVSVNQVVIDKD